MCNHTSYFPELEQLDVIPDYRQFEKLLDKNLVLQKINEYQAEKITELKNEIGILKKRVAVLAKNSSTSSKPPSSDIIK